jgi:hypothetical protein
MDQLPAQAAEITTLSDARTEALGRLPHAESDEEKRELERIIREAEERLAQLQAHWTGISRQILGDAGREDLGRNSPGGQSEPV